MTEVATEWAQIIFGPPYLIVPGLVALIVTYRMPSLGVLINHSTSPLDKWLGLLKLNGLASRSDSCHRGVAS